MTEHVITCSEFKPALLSDDAIADLIQRSGWVDDLDYPQILLLAKHGYAYEAQPSKVLVREGDQESYMGVVLKGRLQIVKSNNSKVAKTLATVSSGRTFGEMSLVDGEPRSASIISVERTVVLILTKQSFVELSRENPKLGVQVLFKLSKTISQRLRQTSGQLIDLMDA